MAMLFPNDLKKDPRKQTSTHAAHERVALSASSRARALSLSLSSFFSLSLRHLVNSARAKRTDNRVSRFPNFEQPGSRRLVICG
jgi:hypothetical protein